MNKEKNAITETVAVRKKQNKQEYKKSCQKHNTIKHNEHCSVVRENMITVTFTVITKLWP